MQMQVAPDGRVFYVDRLGAVDVILPGSNQVVTAGNVNPFTANESGALGIALDPGFDTNHWVYVFYSPQAKSVDQISRFTLNSDNTLNMASEKVVLEVPVQRNTCCHHGGSMLFDKDGNLWLSTGDNTNPFGSPTNAYAPLDFRDGMETQDSSRTSGNTNSLSGKVLRIHPQADGSYTVPDGNLFPDGTAKTRPEIYAMGFRNPFRLGTDPKTGLVIVGEYGPDASTADPKRGPENTVEWDVLSKPGNYGWPFCIGNNQPYVHYDYATGVSGDAYDCAGGPVNDSPHNTGLTQLPKPVPASVWSHYTADPAWPAVGGAGAPMAGPVYRYDPDLNSGTKWPAYYDGKEIAAEWNSGRMYTFQLSDDQTSVLQIDPLLDGMGFKKPMDMKFGPDGALYVIDWGSGFDGNNQDSGIYRVDYIQGNRPPTARLSADRTDGPAPLTVHFSSAGSDDPNKDGALTYAWDFDSDGTVDSTEADPAYTYPDAGNRTASLTVTNKAGKSASATLDITVGNSTPTITIDTPAEGGAFAWGDRIPFKVTVTDPEDGPVDCSQVTVQASLGHDTHAHALDQFHSCSGTVQTPVDTGHGAFSNLFFVLEARYTDHGGAGGSKALTGDKSIIFQTQDKQAEYYTSASAGVTRTDTADPIGGNQDVTGIDDGSTVTIDPVNLTGVDSLTFRVAALAGGTVEAHESSADGPLAAKVTVPAGNGSYRYLTAPVTDPGGTHPLVLVFKGSSAGAKNLLRLNWIHFGGKGVAEGNTPPFVQVDASPLTGDTPLKVDFTAAATDPEGQAVSYAWDFDGDGKTDSTEAKPSHTFTAPGTWTATVTATDPDGASGTATVTGRTDTPPVECLGTASDEFTGDQLDTGRWSVVRQDQNLKVTGGNLVIPTSDTDIYSAGGNTPDIVLQPAPSGAWQATTKLTLPADRSYQQAGLVLYGDDDNYAKLVYEGRATNGPDAGQNIFQFIREENGDPHEVSASNTGALGAAYPQTVYLRITSDGSNITAAYSADGSTFTTMPETKPIAGIGNPRIGLVSLAGNGTTPPVDAAFDWFHLTPDPTAAAPGPSDEFDGATLDGCRWTRVVRPDLTHMRVADGSLRIDTGKGDIYGTPNSDPSGFLLQKAPDTDWTIETKVDGSAFNQQYHQGGLIAYKDDDNYVKLDYLTDNQPGQALVRRIELRGEAGGTVLDPQPGAGDLTQGVWYLRLAKRGDTFRGYYSADGTTWTEVAAGGAAATVSNPAVAAGAHAGLFAFGVNQTEPVTAKFDWFHADWSNASDTAAPVTEATADPAAPDGDGGWYTSPVSVTLAATDGTGGSGVAGTEYRIDDATDWTRYTGPVRLTDDGEHTLAYRSTDKAGNVEQAGSVTVRIDATAPSVLPTGVTDGTSYGDSTTVTPGAAAADAGSGIGSTVLTLDGKEVAAGTALPLLGLDLGRHELAAVATDKAGNTTRTVSGFTVTTSYQDMQTVIDRFRSQGDIDAKTAGKLHDRLQRASDAADRKLDHVAAVQLENFRKEAADPAVVGNAQLRTVLVRDARYLIDALTKAPGSTA
nr:PQQ-dependent sugar dehydrogenase [Peterkaempfera griseoplana]